VYASNVVRERSFDSLCDRLLLEGKGNGFWLINSIKLTLSLKSQLGVDVISSLL